MGRNTHNRQMNIATYQLNRPYACFRLFKGPHKRGFREPEIFIITFFWLIVIFVLKYQKTSEMNFGILKLDMRMVAALYIGFRAMAVIRPGLTQVFHQLGPTGPSW